jgi:hypothetical protein
MSNLTLQQHPLSAAFPAMPDDEFLKLKDSIENIGVQNPIVLFEGQVIDGWHRYRAAAEVRIDCPVVQLAYDVDPRDFVIAQNERRRHLNQGQIALASASIYAWYPSGANKSATVIPGITVGKTNAEIAAIAGVSVPTIRQAKSVQSNAEPEVQAAVKSGEISLKTAAAVAKLPPDEQKQAAAAGATAMRKAAKPVTIDSTCDVVDGQSELDELRERFDELATNLKGAVEDNESMGRVFDANDQVAAAIAEATKSREMNRVLESRVTGLMNELAEVKRMLKIAQRRAERAEAALSKEVA